MAQSNLSLWDFFFGKTEDALSSTNSKLVAMTSHIGGLMVFISLVYFVIDLINNLNSMWYLQLGYAFISLLVVIANRKGFHNSARILLVVSGNIIVFLFAITEPPEIGVSVLFVTAYIGAIVGFGFEKRKIAFTLITFTTVLLLFSVIIDLHLVEKKVFSAEYIKVNFIINLLVTVVTSIIMVYYLLTLNYFSESNLQESQKAILEKNNELLKLNKELDRFVYSTSHDLRSPISSVRGLINILRLSDNPAEIKGYMAMMEDRLVHLDKFIGDIANYSRNARLTLSIKQVRLREVIDDCIKNLAFFPGADKVKVTIQVPADLTILSDQMRLEILLANVISNAFKYHDPRKERQSIKIESIINESTIQLSIEDNGIGIPNDYLNKIFDMFVQAHDKSKGSGLGLYIVKETLEKLNGSIEVTSQEGLGSKFTITLPKKYAVEVEDTISI